MFSNIRLGRRFAVLPIALAAAASQLTPASAATAPVAWASTAAKGVPLSLAGLVDNGRAGGTTPLTLIVALNLRDRAALDAYMARITNPADPLYKHYLRPDQFAEAYGPKMADADAVIRYLAAKGFTNIALSPNRTQIRVQGTVAQAEAAFNTEIHRVQFGGQSALANLTAAQVPAALGSTVLSVIGLNTIQTYHLNPPQKKGSATPAVGLPPTVPSTQSINGFTPQQYWTAYNVGTTPAGTKSSVAVFTEGTLVSVVGTHPEITDASDPNFDAKADLRVAETTNKLAHVPVTVVNTGTGDHSDAAGADEWDIDTQSSTGIAGGVKHLYLYNGSDLSTLEVNDTYNRFVTDNLAQMGNASFGECESLAQTLDASLGATDQIFLQAAAQGQTVFASSGDAGSSCFNAGANGVPAGVQGVESPASGTYVVGVGGTTLLTDTTYNYSTEATWYAGGGGTSTFEKAGAWMTKVLPTGATGYKGVPDIAMDADPNTGMLIYVGGVAQQYGGTSLASPLAMGVWARLQSARVTDTNPNPLGFAPPDLYNLVSGPAVSATGFHDVVAGSNGAFTAGPGYDYTTGLGTFDVSAMNTALGKAKIAPVLPAVPKLGGDVCTVPGYEIGAGTKGANTDAPASGHSPLASYLSEAYKAGQADALTFSMDVDAINSTLTLYTLYFTADDGVQYFVAYEPTPDPTATAGTVGAAKFTYGHYDSTNGTTADGIATGSTATVTSNGTSATRITWTIPKTAISALGTTKKLIRIYGAANTESGFFDTFPLLTPLAETAQGDYTLDRANFCAPAPVAGLTATPTTLFAGSAVAFDASTSTATIGPVTSYTFDFGDGTTATQAKPTANHVYSTAGKYTASVSVVDSNQKTSTNAPTQAITVNAPMVDNFSFAARTDVDVSTVVTSEAVTLSGTSGASFPVSISGGTNAQYSVDGGPFTSDPGTIKTGQKLVVRQTSSSAYSTKTSETVTVGTYSTTFDVTTKAQPASTTPSSGGTSTGGSTGTTTAGQDHVPDPFDFGETDNVVPGQPYTSSAVTPVNYDNAPVTASQGITYSINGGAFTAGASTISKGQTIRVQLTSSKTSLGYAKGYVTIGGVKGYYTLRTRK